MIRTRSLVLFLASALAASPLAAQTPQTGGAAAPSPARPATTAPAAPAARLLDINSATKEELDALPGIGEARSAAIIKGRPYRGKDELLQKKILPQNVYDAIKDRIIARQA